MTHAAATAMLETLQRWRMAGALRALDVAFARLLHEIDGEAPASLLLAGAIAAQMEGRGHDCVELAQLSADAANDLLGWAAPSSDELLARLPDWAAQRAAWQGSPLIELEPNGPVDAIGTVGPIEADSTGGRSPLVLHRGRLYLRRYWTWESRVAAQVHARTSIEAESGGQAAIAEAQARRWLDRLFPARPEAKARGPKGSEAEIDWQRRACGLALHGRFTVITGGPGTGKTYTAARLLVLLQALHRGTHPLRVALAAPTGKAAARLRQAIEAALAELRPTIEREIFGHDPTAPPAAARTLHALLGARPGTRRFRHDASQPLEVDVLFVDEASMVHLEMMDALLDALPPHARLVLLGDKDQLASVEAGAVLGDLCAGDDVTGEAPARHVAMLRESHRFGGAIGELAAAVNRGDAKAVLQRLMSSRDPAVAHAPAAHEGAALRALAIEGRAGTAGGLGAPGACGYRACFEQLRERPSDPAAFEPWALSVLRAFDRVRVLCAVREGPQGVQAVNLAIEQALVEAKLLPARRNEWYEGRPVMVTRNDAGLGVFNGDIGIALAPPGAAGQPLRVYMLDGGTALRSVSSGRLADVQTAFALTVHKSQGSEFEHVVLVLPGEDVPVLTRELLYTAITRAKAAFTLAAAEPALVRAAVQRLTRRGSGLRELLRPRKG